MLEVKCLEQFCKRRLCTFTEFGSEKSGYVKQIYSDRQMLLSYSGAVGYQTTWQSMSGG